MLTLSSGYRLVFNSIPREHCFFLGGGTNITSFNYILLVHNKNLYLKVVKNNKYGCVHGFLAFLNVNI